jgi:hypothetical protein
VNSLFNIRDIVRFAHSSLGTFSDAHHFLRYGAKMMCVQSKSFWRRVSEANNVVQKANTAKFPPMFYVKIGPSVFSIFNHKINLKKGQKA